MGYGNQERTVIDHEASWKIRDKKLLRGACVPCWRYQQLSEKTGEVAFESSESRFSLLGRAGDT